MMRIAFAGSFASRLAEPVRTRLLIPCELIVDESEAGIVARLAEADMLVSMRFNKAMADAGRRLRLVQVPGAGLDRVDQTALRHGMRLANAYGHEVGIAEYILGTMLTLTRSLAAIDASLRRGRWDSQWAIGTPPPPLWPELAGKTLGILGFGHIGEAVARRAQAFDMQVWAMRRSVPTERPAGVSVIVGPERLDELLARVDYLAVTLPLSPETHNLLDARRLAMLKPTAYLINVARAQIIDEAALYQALASRQIAGAALDVWYRYPTTAEPTLPANLPFQDLDNVIMTPHASAWTQGMLDARADVIAQNIARLSRGEPLVNAIETG